LFVRPVKRRRDKARHVSHAGLGGTREEIKQTRLAIRCDGEDVDDRHRTIALGDDWDRNVRKSVRANRGEQFHHFYDIRRGLTPKFSCKHATTIAA
jgi:hypothetical protein